MGTQVVELTGDEARLLRSFDKVIQKELELERRLASAGEGGVAAGTQIEGAMARVERESAKAFREVLKDLNRLGPDGRKVSEELKKHLVDAGKIGEKSMEDVIRTLEKLDPESAVAARKFEANVKQSADGAETSIQKFGKSAVTSIGSMVAAYVGVQEAVQLVNDYLADQRDLLAEARDTQLDLAKAQQEAAKNLAGLTVVERDGLLKNAVPEIAATTGFADVAEITQALGAVASAGESRPDAIANAVRQAARIERLTPEQLDTTAAAASAVQRQAGLDDIRQAIALVETTGTQARITDPQKLVESLPKAVGSLVATVPSQNSEEASRQAAALFAQITQGGNDEKGLSSSTFATDFGTRLSKFFSDISDERVDARSRIDLIDRKIAKGTETESDRLKRGRLIEFLSASDGLQDPGTLFGRLEAVRSAPALSRQFVGEGFGEKQFQTALASLLDSQSELSAALQKSFETIQANPAFFEREANQLANATPQLALAAAKAASDAAIRASQVSNTEGSTLQQVRDIVSETINESNPGFMRYATNFVQYGSLAGQTAVEEAFSGIQELQGIRRGFRSDGVLTEDEQRADVLVNQQIRNIISLIRSEFQRGALDQAGVDEVRKVTDFVLGGGRNIGGPRFDESDLQLFREMRDALQDIAETNAETAENTIPTPAEPPPATPALSAQQP